MERENPSGRWKEEARARDGNRRVWTVRMTDEWLDATDEVV